MSQHCDVSLTKHCRSGELIGRIGMFSSFERIRPLAALVARLVLGAIMVVHGSQKIFPRGALYQFTQFVAHLGLPYWLGYVAAFTELFGGALIILGLLVHLAAL